jgi:hypothetical protein
MKFNQLEIKGYNERGIFNLLHDIYQELPIKEASVVNKIYYPKMYVTLPISSPSCSFIDRKNVILVGAGSGIAPFLPLLEEIVK